MKSFHEIGLPKSLVTSLNALKLMQPTPIQAEAIPVALSGADILGSAQTGTGKTAAFSVPLIAKVLEDPKLCGLIITPTRELAAQVAKAVRGFLQNSPHIRTALLIGGEPMFRQYKQLDHKPRIVIGTPGRINDHLKRNKLRLDKTQFLVLDETDRMLDMGFSVQIDEIIKHMPEKRQTLLFSATLPKGIVRMAEAYLHQPKRIAIGATSVPAKNVKQAFLHISQKEKSQQLLTQLDQRDGSILVFVKTKRGAEKMTKWLREEQHSVDTIHGDLRQNKRERVIKAFRNRRYRIMVATDIAARGLDIPHIEHVINYDLPQCPEDYIHRIGRTARAGASGESICFVAPSERRQFQAIDALLNPHKKPSKSGSRPQNKSKKKSFSAKKKFRPQNKAGKPNRGSRRAASQLV